jgi:hypothetical protein
MAGCGPGSRTRSSSGEGVVVRVGCGVRPVREPRPDLAHRRAPRMWCPRPPALAADGVCGGPLAQGTLGVLWLLRLLDLAG